MSLLDASGTNRRNVLKALDAGGVGIGLGTGTASAVTNPTIRIYKSQAVDSYALGLGDKAARVVARAVENALNHVNVPPQKVEVADDVYSVDASTTGEAHHEFTDWL